MDASLLQVLPNLGVGAIAVLAFAYTTIKNNESRESNTEKFLAQLREMRAEHETAMKEREAAFRELEREVRNKILDQLNKNTSIMERLMTHMDTH